MKVTQRMWWIILMGIAEWILWRQTWHWNTNYSRSPNRIKIMSQLYITPSDRTCFFTIASYRSVHWCNCVTGTQVSLTLRVIFPAWPIFAIRGCHNGNWLEVGGSFPVLPYISPYSLHIRYARCMLCIALVLSIAWINLAHSLRLVPCKHQSCNEVKSYWRRGVISASSKLWSHCKQCPSCGVKVWPGFIADSMTHPEITPCCLK